ncbi:MAG: hypothetical protein HQ477_07815 [Chloroflexi bacterium]|nr:hypothetical protein [Chloroflexota bacterium]
MPELTNSGQGSLGLILLALGISVGYALFRPNIRKLPKPIAAILIVGVIASGIALLIASET